MVQLGMQIVPDMPIRETIDTIRAAEDLGYDFCLICDEGFMRDVYVTLGAAAQETTRVRLGPTTNGYTRHPMVTAAALATVNELSGGRAMVMLVAGGASILESMGMARSTPLAVMDDTVEILRRLWLGQAVTWQGRHYRLNAAQLAMGKQDIPIWLGVRGPKLLRLAGEKADGVALIVRSDLGPALQLVEQGSARSGRRPQRAFLERVCYVPEMVDRSGLIDVYAVVDSPDRMLKGLGMTDEAIAQIRRVAAAEGPVAAARLITPEMTQAFQIIGTPAECCRTLQEVIAAHALDAFVANINCPGLAANIRLMENLRAFVREPERFRA